MSGPASPARTRVAVNLLWLVPGVVGGSEDGTVALLHALADHLDSMGADRELDVVLFGLAALTEAHPDLLERYEHELLAMSGAHRGARIVAETVWLPRRLRARGFDVVHHAGGVVPLLAGRSSSASVVLTVHDVQPLVLPHLFSPLKRQYLSAMLPRSVRAASVVLAPTEHARSTVIDALHARPDAVAVSPFGPTHEIIEPPTAEERAAVRARYDLPGPFFLYPAITYAHKNHRVLLDAFAALTDDLPSPAPNLVFTGGRGGAELDVAEQIERLGLARAVRRTGRISRRDLDVLFTEATAVAFPSCYEGFGLPVLEAMSAGTPVLAADATALPEVVGGAGLLLDPGSPADWAGAMRRVLTEPAFAADLAARSRERAAAPAFSAEHAAEVLVRAYQRAAGVEVGKSGESPDP